ncbi:hypothetical protein EMIT0P260_180011 [Pseudomonas sp. IT-P260]
MGGDSGVPDGGRGDLRDELPEHAGAELALRLFRRAGVYHGGVREFVGEFQEVGVVVGKQKQKIAACGSSYIGMVYTL